MATSGKQLSSLPSASSIAGNNEFLTWIGNNTAQKVSRDDFVKSLPTYRQPSTAYSAGQIAYHSALPTGWYLECTTPGTSGSGDLSISSPAIGGTISDGTVVWTISRDLPISGGAMTSGNALKRNVNNSYLRLAGGQDSNSGSWLSLMGKDSIDHEGDFYLEANNGSNSNRLSGFPNGGLTWGGSSPNDLGGSAIVAKSPGANGYIKYASGLIVQWGISYTTTSAYTQNFPINFTANCSVALTSMIESESTDYSITVKSVSTAGFSYKNTPAVNSIGFSWIAIGY